MPLSSSSSSFFVLFYLSLSLFFSTCYSTIPHLYSSLSPHVLSFSSSSFQNEENRYIFLHSGTINTKTEKDILKMKERELEGIFQFLIHVEEVNTSYTEKITKQIEEWSGKVVNYIPRNSYHITCDLRCAYDLYSFAGVLWISPFLYYMKLSPFFSPSLSSRSFSSLSSSFSKASLLPHRNFGKLDISVSIVSPPSLLRKRDRKEETGDREYVNSVVRKWEIEYRERENKKRNIEERTIVTMNPISENKIQVSVFHNEDKIINEIAEWIAKQAETQWIEPKLNPKTNNLNSRANIQTGSTDVNSVWAWDHGLKGEGEVIGIGDSGLNTQHCFFFDPSTPVSFNSTNLNHRKVVSYWYFGDNTENKNGHGTHTAGSIAGTPADPLAPLSSYSGSAPEAKISFVDIGHTDGTLFLPDDLNQFYSLTYESTARIHSDSWGTSVYPYYNNVAQQIDEFHYNHKDFLNIRSVGNEGDSGYGTVNGECTSKNSLCVGSSISAPLSFINGPYYTDYGKVIEDLDKYLCVQNRDAPLYNLTCDANNRTQLTPTNCCDTQYRLRSSCCQSYITSVMIERMNQFSISNYALFSSRGPTVDSRVKPDVIVPGVDIFSSRSLLGQGDNYCSNTPYAEAPETSAILVLSGTSQSTALLAGAAGLLRQYIREGYWKTGSKDLSAGFSPSGAFLKAALINSAVYLNSSIYDSTNLKFVLNTTDDYTYSPENTFSQGFGRVQLNQVMWFGDSDYNIFSSSNSSKDVELSANEFHSYCFKAQESRPFKATLVWTDPPAHPASFMSLVNDLDLLVYDDSSLMYGNGQISADGNLTSDGVNNVEQVTKTKINGTIQVYVLGSVVPKGPQAYSLFVSGKFEPVICPECYYDPKNIVSRECNVSHGIGVAHCQPGGFFGKCKVTVCDSGYVERSLLNPDGCSATVSLTIYSAAIMFGIALISILCFVVLCSKVGHRRWQEFKPKKSKPNSMSNILLVAKLAQPESWLLITGTIASLVVVGLSLIVPLISADIFDLLYASEETVSRKSRINTSIAILAGVTVGIIVFEFIQNIILSLAGHRLVARLRIALFHNIVAQEMAFFDNRSTGEIMSRLATDVGYLRSILASSLPTIVSNTAQFCGGLAMMFIISWRLTLVVLAPVPFMTVMFKFYGAYVNKISLKMQDALADAASSAAETLFNIKTVRWLSGESREVNKFSLLIFGAFDISRRLAFVSGFYSAANGIASHIFTLILLTYGAYLVMDGSLSPSMLLAFNLFVPFVNDAVAALSGLYTSFQTSMGASTRFFELIERDSLIPTDEGNILVKSKGNISIANVSFRYPGRPDALILNDISIDFVPGTITALVGPSGSGKTTILSLIGRIYDPEGGKITLDGYDIKSLNTASLHTHIGIVNQEPSLFSGTIFENVGYANDKASKEDIIEACKKAHAHEFISTFPDGYDTDLGERGTQLSGGQKQRIAIARAILMNPTILLLDEATSELDVESEHLVQQALETLMKGKTVIIVAHRLSTVLAADVIAVIAEGGVKEKGTHEDLIAAKGIYYEFVERQWSKVGGVPDIIKRSNSLGERSASQATIKQRKYLRAREMSLKMLPIQINEEDDSEGSQAGESSDTRSHRSNSPMIKKKSSTSIIWKKAEPPKSTKDQKKLIEKSIRKIRKSTMPQPNRN